MKRPTCLYPTLARGIISGPIRCESLDGSEIWLPPANGILRIEPFNKDGKTYAVSHMQKASSSGYLLMSPFIFHAWHFWKHQAKDSAGGWLPGTEQGIYTRSPGWRWDVAGTNGEHWIFSKGFLGGHWD
jgi:hypothetical protein